MKRERIKNCILVMELLIMVVFLVSTWGYILGESSDIPFADILNRFISGNEIRKNSSGVRGAAVTAVHPVSAAAGYNGVLYGAARDSALVSSVYERISTVLTEAIGSLEPGTEVSEQELKNALNGDMAFICFDGQIPLAVIGGLQEIDHSDMAEYSENVDFILLSADGEEVALYYRASSTGRVMMCKTSARSKNLIQTLSEYDTNNAYFAFNGGENFNIFNPEMLIPMDAECHPGVIISSVADISPGSNLMTVVLETFGINPYTVRKYESRGADVYVQDLVTVRVSGDGTLDFSASESADFAIIDGLASATDEINKILVISQDARDRLNNIYANMGFDNGIYLRGISYDADRDKYRLSFGCEVGGIPIAMADGSEFAGITIQGKRIVSAHLTLRGYQISGENGSIMPEEQMAAALSARKSGHNRLRAYVCYMDNGESALSAEWYIQNNSMEDAIS